VRRGAARRGARRGAARRGAARTLGEKPAENMPEVQVAMAVGPFPPDTTYPSSHVTVTDAPAGTASAGETVA